MSHSNEIKTIVKLPTSYLILKYIIKVNQGLLKLLVWYVACVYNKEVLHCFEAGLWDEIKI